MIFFAGSTARWYSRRKWSEPKKSQTAAAVLLAAAADGVGGVAKVMTKRKEREDEGEQERGEQEREDEGERSKRKRHREERQAERQAVQAVFFTENILSQKCFLPIRVKTLLT